MNNYKKITISISMFSLLISGCASNDMQMIEQTKQQLNNNKADIHLNISNDLGYKAYLDRDNNLKFICVNKNDFCNYYSPKKHSYKNGTPEEEYVSINKDGYYPPLSPYTKNVQCGTGSLGGWLVIFGGAIDKLKFKNYSKQHPRACNSRFTTVDSTQIGERFVAGLITFMTPLVTGGTLHTNKFDKQKFIDAIYKSNIEAFRTQLLDSVDKFNIDSQS
jgi:hypothetical protein